MLFLANKNYALPQAAQIKFRLIRLGNITFEHLNKTQKHFSMCFRRFFTFVARSLILLMVPAATETWEWYYVGLKISNDFASHIHVLILTLHTITGAIEFVGSAIVRALCHNCLVPLIACQQIKKVSMVIWPLLLPTNDNIL